MELHRALLDTIAGLTGMSTDEYHGRMNELLAPISTWVNAEDCQKICTAIIADHDGNDAFDIRDLELLACDVPAVIELAKSCALIIVSLKKMKFVYTSGASEGLLLKLLCYVLIMVLPEQTEKILVLDDLRRIASIAFAIYDNLENMQVIRNIFTETIAAFHKRSLCVCIAIHDDPQQVLDAKLPVHIRSLGMHVQKNRMLAGSALTSAPSGEFDIIQIK